MKHFPRYLAYHQQVFAKIQPNSEICENMGNFMTVPHTVVTWGNEVKWNDRHHKGTLVYDTLDIDTR
jgi:hypothetical protein